MLICSRLFDQKTSPLEDHSQSRTKDSLFLFSQIDQSHIHNIKQIKSNKKQAAYYPQQARANLPQLSTIYLHPTSYYYQH
jgi:hypothetical protein